MRTLLTLTFLLACATPAFSQFPTWKIKPTNDTIYIMEGSTLIRGEKPGKTTIWNLHGQQLYSTGDKVNKFQEGVATVLKKDTWEIIGFLDTEGNFTSLPHLSVAYNNPHYENGYLIAKRRGKYAMFSKDGKEQPLPELTAAYPFSNGYAIYKTYENPEKMKKPFFNYLKGDGTPMERFILKEKDKEKPIEPKNISFLSAVDKDGRSLAIVKNKFYWFDASDESLTPVLMGDESEKKRHLALIEDKDQDFSAITDGKLRLQGKYGKDQVEEYELDSRLRLLRGGKPNLSEKSTPGNLMANAQSILETYKENGVYGLIYEGEDSLPSQFEQIGVKYENNAFVKNKGKWGVLTLTPSIQFDITLNDGDTISFRHQKYPTQMHINLPDSITSKGIRIDMAETERMSIDLASKENRDTKTGNFINYNCVISVPTNLTDSVATIKYGPLELIRDNVRMHPIYVGARACYSSPYTVDIPNKGLTIDQNHTTFDIVVNVDKEEGEEDYPYSLKVESDALMARIEKTEENKYKCHAENLDDGIHDLDIILTETGCPSTVLPLQIVNTRKGTAYIAIRQPETEAARDTTAKVQEDKANVKKETTKKSALTSAKLNRAPLFIKYANGYLVAEVTDENPKLTSGCGETFPAPTYMIDGVGQTEIPSPYTGQLIKVKDEGEYFLKFPSVASSHNPQPEYISRKSVKLVRSNPFKLKEIEQPLIYVATQEIFNEANNKEEYIDEVLTYPGGLCVEYSEGKSGSTLKFGNIIDGKPAIEWQYRIQTNDSGDMPEGSKSNVLLDNNQSMHRIRLSIAPQDKKTLTSGKKEMRYLDLSEIGEEAWKNVLKDFLLIADSTYDKHEITEYECDILTRDMLDKKYTKVNK